jgi:hypothetical protein
MASTGDPSTFTFTMDAMPGYTYFNPTRKVLCAIQIIEDSIKEDSTLTSVFPHADDKDTTDLDVLKNDSVPENDDGTLTV